MKRFVTKLSAAVLVMIGFGSGATGQGAPVTGMTYTYDLSMADPGSGQFTTPHMDADDTEDMTLLTDGELGDQTNLSDPNLGCCLFNNGTYAGFINNGFGGAPQPKIDVDLGGRYAIDSLTLYYLVEDGPSIYAPQPVSDGSGGILFNALTVFGSTDGANFLPLGSTNDFRPVFGLDGDFGSGVRERRSAVVELGGVEATHLSIDVRTPFSFIFLGEFVVDGTAVGGLLGDYNGNNIVDAADYTYWRDRLGTGEALPNEGASPGMIDLEDYTFWKSHFGETAGGPGAAAGKLGVAAARTIPEPATPILFALGWTSILIRRRLFVNA